MNVETTRTLANSWLLLIHRLPAKPAYLRVKVWRRLQGVGAVKNPMLSVAAAVVIFRFKVIIPILAAFCFAGIVPYLVGATS